MRTLFFIFIIYMLTSCKAGFPIETKTGYSTGGKCKSVQCYSRTKSGNRCKNTTTNCSGRCHVH